MLPIVIGALGTIPKGLVKELGDIEIRGQVETIQTIALLKSARILWRFQDTWINVKNSQKSKIVIIIIIIIIIMKKNWKISHTPLEYTVRT